jgi:hypothetical protein
VLALLGVGLSFWVRLTPAHLKIARAQGGITPGPIGAEVNADFPILGTRGKQLKHKNMKKKFP